MVEKKDVELVSVTKNNAEDKPLSGEDSKEDLKKMGTISEVIFGRFLFCLFIT